MTEILTKWEMKKNSNSVKLIIKRLLTALTAKSLVVKVLGALGVPKHLIFMVPKRGLEPLQAYTH